MNQSITLKSLTSFVAAVLLAFPACVSAAEPKGNPANPDFTKGDTIPAKAKHDWNLGPTGLRGWMFCDKLVTTDARQIYVTQVQRHSPADEILAVGDVILGVGGGNFSGDARVQFANAITAAEQEKNGGLLRLVRWLDGQSTNVELKLPVLGAKSCWSKRKPNWAASRIR